MPRYQQENSEIHYQAYGNAAGPVFIWGHGWGQSLHAFTPLVETVSALGRHISIDFPGFGDSPRPSESWSTKEYADALAGFIREQNLGPVIWVGHSFGGRVGIQLAVHHPDLVHLMVLIASAGLRPQRSLRKTIYLKARVAAFKILKHLLPWKKTLVWLYRVFGSRDYASAQNMRDILVKVIHEDLSAACQDIRCPTLLVYGTDDTETPPEMGRRLHNLIADSKIICLDGFDHYSVLTDARHQVAKHIKRFIEENKKHES